MMFRSAKYVRFASSNAKTFPDDKWLAKQLFNSSMKWWDSQMRRFDAYCQSPVQLPKEVDNLDTLEKWIHPDFVKFKAHCWSRQTKHSMDKIQASNGYKATVDSISKSATTVGTQFCQFLENNFKEEQQACPEKKSEKAK